MEHIGFGWYNIWIVFGLGAVQVRLMCNASLTLHFRVHFTSLQVYTLRTRTRTLSLSHTGMYDSPTRTADSLWYRDVVPIGPLAVSAV